MAKKINLFSLMSSMNREIGIDVGTGNTVVFMKGAGIILREPSVVAVDKRTDEVIAVGKQAKEMLGKSPAGIHAIRPVQSGMIADFDACSAMLRAFMKKAVKSGPVGRPRIIISVPSGATEVERAAAEDVARHSGGSDVSLIKAPMAAAIGAGLSPVSAKGYMVVNLGAGLTEVAVIALGDVLASATVKMGGNTLDDSITRYIKRKYALQIGELTAEEIKIKVGSAFPGEDSFSLFTEVKGRGVLDNLPKNITVRADEIRVAVVEALSAITEAIVRTTEALPPEIAGDLLEQGIMLTGGGALLRGVDKYFGEATGLPVRIAERPIDAVAEGLGRSLDAAASKRQSRRR